MKILGIETSCDETAISLIDMDGGFENPSFRVLGNKTVTQIDIHKPYGGVYPNLAKREHAKNLVPILREVLAQAGMETHSSVSEKLKSEILNLKSDLNREPELFDALSAYLPTIARPPIDAIAVTFGPGLEPALWVGINFALALGKIWDIPVIPTNHMEGHIVASLLKRNDDVNAMSYVLCTMSFPSLALLISGGHTEFVRMKDWLHYEVIGQTKDDAVGEAFDKVARMLGLPYPGGPEISKLASDARSKELDASRFSLPRPMIDTDDLDFSFSGLKTAVLYLVKKLGALDDTMKMQIAREFEDAVVEVLVAKTRRAFEREGFRALVLGGGVIANTEIRKAFEQLGEELGVPILFPSFELSTDNALMIAIAGYFNFLTKNAGSTDIKASGNVRLGSSSSS